MKNISLKLIQSYWHEILFLCGVVGILIEILISKSDWKLMDNWDLFVFISFSGLMLCLLGNLFLKNRKLGIFLAFLFGVISIIVMLMAIYGIAFSISQRKICIIMLISGAFLVTTAFKMRLKFLQ
jgi:hypothetical protein